MVRTLKRVLLLPARLDGVEYAEGVEVDMPEDLKQSWITLGIIAPEEQVTLPADATRNIFDRIEERIEERKVETALKAEELQAEIAAIPATSEAPADPAVEGEAEEVPVIGDSSEAPADPASQEEGT